MNIYTLTLKTYPDYQELGEVSGEFEKIKEIFIHSMNGCSESEKARHLSAISGNFESSGGCFKYDNGTIISYDIRKINLKDVPIPSGYTRLSNYALVFIFPEDAEKIHKIIDSEIKDLDCVDNVRVALSSNEESVKMYEKARKDGCCGSFDKEFVINGKIYLIGCNYGH